MCARLQVPNGAYGHFLLGRIAKLTTRGEKAAAHFEKCLILNPMMWNAYEELCALGAPVLASVPCLRGVCGALTSAQLCVARLFTGRCVCAQEHLKPPTASSAPLTRARGQRCRAVRPPARRSTPQARETQRPRTQCLPRQCRRWSSYAYPARWAAA